MSDCGFEEFQDLALCSGLLIAIIQTTLPILISIRLLIPHMQSCNLSMYLLARTFNKSYFKDLLKLGISVTVKSSLISLINFLTVNFLFSWLLWSLTDTLLDTSKNNRENVFRGKNFLSSCVLSLFSSTPGYSVQLPRSSQMVLLCVVTVLRMPSAFLYVNCSWTLPSMEGLSDKTGSHQVGKEEEKICHSAVPSQPPIHSFFLFFFLLSVFLHFFLEKKSPYICGKMLIKVVPGSKQLKLHVQMGSKWLKIKTHFL